MTTFERIKLGDLVTWAKGCNIPRDDTSVNKSIPYLHYGDLYKKYDYCLNLPEVINDIIKIDSLDSVKEPQMLHDGDIVFTLTSETVDDLGHCTLIINPDYMPFVSGMETTVLHLKESSKALPTYLNYIFQDERFRKIMRQYVTGMKVYRIHPKDLMRIEINLPPLDVQAKIVSILDSFSDSIINLGKINDNLHKMAYCIYESYKSTHDYEMTPLSTIAKINERSISKNDNFKEINYLETSSITSGLVEKYQHFDMSSDIIPSRARRIVKANDIVFSTVRPDQHHFGILTTIPNHCVVSTGFITICSSIDTISNEMIYLEITKENVVKTMQQIAESSTSTYPSIRPEDLGNTDIPLFVERHPLVNSLRPIFQQIDHNNRRIRILCSFKENLLSKLISGIIDISTIEISTRL